MTPVAAGSSAQPLSPADRIRIIHSYISSTPSDGGLGISSDSSDWDLVHSMFPLHNRQFNTAWVKTWKPRNITSMSLNSIREEVWVRSPVCYSLSNNRLLVWRRIGVLLWLPVVIHLLPCFPSSPRRLRPLLPSALLSCLFHPYRPMGNLLRRMVARTRTDPWPQIRNTQLVPCRETSCTIQTRPLLVAT